MERFKFIVSSEDIQVRLDAFLAKNLSPDISRSRVKKLVIEKRVSVNSQPAKPSLKLHPGDEIVVEVPQEAPGVLTPWSKPLAIIYEDEDILVIDKPAGLTVHPGAGNRQDTLANALVAYTEKLSNLDPRRPGIVHRLDKDTSGLLVLARNNQAYYELVRQFKEREIKKAYLAVVEGQVQFDQGVIDAPITPDPRHRERMKVDFSCPRSAITEYKVLKRLGNFSLVELHPITGRTHQLRVHMKYLGHPIVGDKKYQSRFKLGRLALHAQHLSLVHPKTKEVMEFTSPVPEDIGNLIKDLQQKDKKS